MKDHKHYQIWSQVPVDYYQSGINGNFLQKIWHLLKIQNLNSMLEKMSFKNCLDVGCASGHMISEISKKYPNVVYFGVDVYDKAIEHAKKVYTYISFKVAPAEKLPFNDSTFDLVISYETIEHVEDPKTALREIKRVLKKDGTAVVAMDSGSFLFRIVWFFWERTKGRVWQGAHLHPFRHNELEQLIKNEGFAIKKKIFSHLGMEVVFILGKG